jgi:hypothetical protein
LASLPRRGYRHQATYPSPSVTEGTRVAWRLPGASRPARARSQGAGGRDRLTITGDDYGGRWGGFLVIRNRRPLSSAGFGVLSDWGPGVWGLESGVSRIRASPFDLPNSLYELLSKFRDTADWLLRRGGLTPDACTAKEAGKLTLPRSRFRFLLTLLPVDQRAGGGGGAALVELHFIHWNSISTP